MENKQDIGNKKIIINDKEYNYIDYDLLYDLFIKFDCNEKILKDLLKRVLLIKMKNGIVMVISFKK